MPTSNDEEEMKNYQDMLPEGSIPVCGFRLVSFITPNGEQRYRLSQGGEVSIVHLLGLIELGKTQLIAAVGAKDDE